MLAYIPAPWILWVLKNPGYLTNGFNDDKSAVHRRWPQMATATSPGELWDPEIFQKHHPFFLLKTVMAIY
jgi:hypothetical protein